MLELARADPVRPYPGQHAVFRAAVREERLRQDHAAAVVAVPVRFEGLPAEYLQVDWGEIRSFPFSRPALPAQGLPGQAGTTRYFLACRLKYSRWMWVRFTTEMRQERLFRGLIDCCCALGWVPWVLVFDNMKTVTTGRDAQRQPVWNPALLQLATEFGFHPEACTPGAANQKGSVESLVGFVKGNFLAGRDFVDDADLAAQCDDWLVGVNARPSQATDMAPLARLPEEAEKGGALPARADDYGFAHAARVSAEALVAVLGNQYSVPIVHTGAPVTVRVHRARIALWRDAVLLAEHARPPDGAHRRVVEPAHDALLFAKKPRAQVMLYRDALLALGATAKHSIAEVSFRRRAQLRPEILGIHALYERVGPDALLVAMAEATARGAYGADARRALLEPLGTPDTVDATPATKSTVAANTARATVPPAAASTTGDLARRAALARLPAQAEVDRQLSVYERDAHLASSDTGDTEAAGGAGPHAGGADPPPRAAAPARAVTHATRAKVLP